MDSFRVETTNSSTQNLDQTQTSDTWFFNPLQTRPHISMLLHGPISAHGVHTIRHVHEILSQSAFIELRATSTTTTELALTIRHSFLTQYLSSFRERPFVTEHKRNETMQRVLVLFTALRCWEQQNDSHARRKWFKISISCSQNVSQC